MLSHPDSGSSARFSRRHFLQASLGIASCLGATAASTGCARKTKSQHPNILLILVDDWGWTDMGAYGSTYYETPHLDRAASDGVRFTNAYASCPVCSPTRAAVMTGKYPPRLNITDWIPGRPQHEFSPIIMPEDSDHLALEETTIAEVLKPVGYTTATIGKWHLGGEGFSPTDQGFDLNIAGTEKGSPSSYFAPYKEQFPGIENPPEGESLTRRLCDEAEKYLETVKDKPFFLYYPLFAVHTPLQAEPEVVAKYEGKSDPRQYQHNATYAAMVESLDDTVGRLRRKLSELGLDKNTIVIITSDNGGLLYPGTRTELVTSNHPLRAGKGHLYEGGTRVPFIVIDPQAKSWVEDTPVASIDLLPTIAAYAGASTPKGVDGVSLKGLIRDHWRLGERDLYWHYPHYSNQGGFPGASVRSGDWKLIENYDSGAIELYNLKSDLHEEHDISKANPLKAQELQAKLNSWRDAVGAKMPTKNPNYDPAKADQGMTGSRRENQ